MAYNAQKIFEAIGKGILKYNTLAGMQTTLDGIMAAWALLINDTIGERALLSSAMQNDDADQSYLESAKLTAIAMLEDFLENEIRADIEVTDENVDEVLDRLIQEMNSAAPPDTVLENTVSASAVTIDEDNVGNGTLTINSTSQQVHDAQFFTVECLDISGGAGAETWKVWCSGESNIGTATTGVAFDATVWGVNFTIAAGVVDFAVGDRFYFSTAITVKSKFQTFFVESFDTALPSVAAGNTIDEAWAS